MNLIFHGMVLLLIDIPLELGEHTVGLLPDWVGYLFLLQGFQVLEDRWEGFRKGQMLLQLMMVYAAIVYVLDYLALSIRMEVVLWVLKLVSAAAMLLWVRRAAAGVQTLERQRNTDLSGKKMLDSWGYLAVLHMMGAALSWMPVVGTVCRVATAVMSLVWLLDMYRCRINWQEMEEEPHETD